MDEHSYIIIFARYICETKRIRNKITYSLPLGIAMLICVRKSAFFKSRAAHAALLSKMQIYEHILHRDTEAGVNNHYPFIHPLIFKSVSMFYEESKVFMLSTSYKC